MSSNLIKNTTYFLLGIHIHVFILWQLIQERTYFNDKIFEYLAVYVAVSGVMFLFLLTLPYPGKLSLKVSFFESIKHLGRDKKKLVVLITTAGVFFWLFIDYFFISDRVDSVVLVIYAVGATIVRVLLTQVRTTNTHISVGFEMLYISLLGLVVSNVWIFVTKEMIFIDKSLLLASAIGLYAGLYIWYEFIKLCLVLGRSSIKKWLFVPLYVLIVLIVLVIFSQPFIYFFHFFGIT